MNSTSCIIHAPTPLFYRVGNELTRTTPGTGIGLALVKQLANTMHAEVDLKNHQPGAEFLVKFRQSQQYAAR